MENIKIKNVAHTTLSLNTLRFLFKQDTVAATKHLTLHRIPFQIILSGEGYWINTFWENGIIAPLTTQELDQLPDYLSIKSRRKFPK